MKQVPCPSHRPLATSVLLPVPESTCSKYLTIYVIFKEQLIEVTWTYNKLYKSTQFAKFLNIYIHTYTITQKITLLITAKSFPEPFEIPPSPRPPTQPLDRFLFPLHIV